MSLTASRRKRHKTPSHTGKLLPAPRSRADNNLQKHECRDTQHGADHEVLRLLASLFARAFQAGNQSLALCGNHNRDSYVVGWFVRRQLQADPCWNLCR